MIKLWCIVQKDLLAEWRARQLWPRMLALGLAVGFLLSYQLTGPQTDLQVLAGNLCWLTVCMASVFAIGQTTAAELENGCWDGLRQYPVSASQVYLAKLIVNFLALAALQCVVVPLLVLLSGAALPRPGQLLLIAALGNLGISAIGTLVGGMTSAVRHGQGLAAVLLLPLLVPVILAASRATTLALVDQLGPEWARWVQLLAAFAVVYVTAGLVLFEFVIEE